MEELEAEAASSDSDISNIHIKSYTDNPPVWVLLFPQLSCSQFHMTMFANLTPGSPKERK